MCQEYQVLYYFVKIMNLIIYNLKEYHLLEYYQLHYLKYIKEYIKHYHFFERMKIIRMFPYHITDHLNDEVKEL